MGRVEDPARLIWEGNVDKVTTDPRAAELYARVEREEREWLEARLHFALHHNWLEREECATCIHEADKAAGA